MKKLLVIYACIYYSLCICAEDKYLTLHTKTDISQYLLENVDSITFDDNPIDTTTDTSSGIDTLNSLNVLLLGSSWGMNTICQFPLLAHYAGVNITAGNLYTGAITIDSIARLVTTDGNWQSYKKFYNGEWHESEPASGGHRSLNYALQDIRWDYIVFSRAASESLEWSNSMDSSFQVILSYIIERIDYSPNFVISTSFAEPLRKWRSREQQLENTDSMNITAYRVSQKYHIGMLPIATALQNARNTNVTSFGTWEYADLASDSQHLDYGVGCYVAACTMFEYFCGKCFNLSVLNIDRYPTFDEISALYNIEANFTPIVPQFAEIAKRAAILANLNPLYISKDLASIYPQ